MFSSLFDRIGQSRRFRHVCVTSGLPPISAVMLQCPLSQISFVAFQIDKWAASIKASDVLCLITAGVHQLIGSSRRVNLYGHQQETHPGIFLLGHRKYAQGEKDFEEVSMARIIVRCKYTGHYVFTTIDTENSPAIGGGCILCPYCGTEHVWTLDEARVDDSQKKTTKLIVRQAS